MKGYGQPVVIIIPIEIYPRLTHDLNCSPDSRLQMIEWNLWRWYWYFPGRGEPVVSMVWPCPVLWPAWQSTRAALPGNMKLKCGIKFKLKNFFSSNHFDPNFSKSVEGGRRQTDKNPVLTSFSCLDTPGLNRKERYPLPTVPHPVTHKISSVTDIYIII